MNQIFNILKQLSGFEKDAEHIPAIKGEVRDMVLDTTLAKEDLGWQPKHSFEQGLEQTFKWFKER